MMCFIIAEENFFENENINVFSFENFVSFARSIVSPFINCCFQRQ